MTHKDEVKLNRFLAKCQAMQDIAICMLGDNGRWHDGTGKGKLVYEVDKAEISDTTVVLAESHNHKFNIKIGGEWKKPMELTDRDLEEMIDAKLKIVKAKKEKEEAKKAAAIQAKSNVSYLDVVKRVAKYAKEHGGYVVKFTEDENAKITMKIGGGHTMIWDNAKDFVSATFDGNHFADFDDRKCVSIFAALFHWESKYYKLAYPSLKKLVKNLMPLTKIGAKPMVPFQIMKELDKLKI